MKHIKDEIVIKKVGRKNPSIVVGINKVFTDIFGKETIQYHAWDNFSTIKQWENAREVQYTQMRNCGYKI